MTEDDRRCFMCKGLKGCQQLMTELGSEHLQNHIFSNLSVSRMQKISTVYGLFCNIEMYISSKTPIICSSTSLLFSCATL